MFSSTFLHQTQWALILLIQVAQIPSQRAKANIGKPSHPIWTHFQFSKFKNPNCYNPARFNPVRKRSVTHKNTSLRCSYDPSLFVSRAHTIPFPLFGCTICSSIRAVCYQDDIIMGLYTDQSGVIETESVRSGRLIVSATGTCNGDTDATHALPYWCFLLFIR